MKKSKSKFSKYLTKYPDGGKTPIQTPDPNKIRAYQDSLSLYNMAHKIDSTIISEMEKGVSPVSKIEKYNDLILKDRPKMDSLSNDLKEIGINYNAKKYNKIPLGEDGEFNGYYGKLQKIPKPKQPYFFKDGGNLPKHNFGSFLGNNLGSIASVVGGLALTATGAGAAAGVPLILGGAGGLAKGITEEVTANKEKGIDTNTRSMSPTYNSNPVGQFRNGGDLRKFNAPSHEGGGQMINKLGVETNNPNTAVAEIEKNETMRGDYIYSDTLGVDKKGNIQTNAKKVHKTFADLSKKIDKKFTDRDDELSTVTKNFMYKNLTDKNEMAIQSKFQKSFSSFQKKWGGMLNKYPFGGSMLGEGLKDYLIQNPISNTAIGSPESYLNTDLDQLQEDGSNILPNNNLNVNTSLNSRLRGETNMTYLPQNNKLIQSPQDKLNTVSTNPINAQKLAQDTPEGANLTDYISPAFNTIAAGISLFSKNKNYLEKPNTEALTTLQNINTTPDYSQLYNRNQRTLRAANSNASNYSPSIRNSLQANNLGIKLNADNEIAFKEQEEKLNREQDKQTRISALQDSNNRFRQAALHNYQNENTQDSSKRQDNALGYLGAAVNDISNIGYDKELGKILNEGLKYYSYDSKTGKYMYKNNVGKVFYSSVSPNEVSKKTTE
jgi:hypothetical protein